MNFQRVLSRRLCIFLPNRPITFFFSLFFFPFWWLVYDYSCYTDSQPLMDLALFCTPSLEIDNYSAGGGAEPFSQSNLPAEKE